MDGLVDHLAVVMVVDIVDHLAVVMVVDGKYLILLRRNTMNQLIGLIMIAGVVGWLYLYFKGKKSIIEESSSRRSDDEKIETLPSDNEVKTHEKLKVIRPTQTISLLGESERAVLASASLYEMTQISHGAPWTRTGAISKALAIAGGIFILKMPGREGGKPIWLKGEEVETFPLKDFYIGTGESPGPARKFKQNNQSSPIDYILPNNLTPDVTWQVVDIGTLQTEVEGESENFENGDRLYFVTSNEKGGQKRLLYLDARKGEARGTGGLFICDPFEPSVDIQEIL
jgi:hypothetical protein